VWPVLGQQRCPELAVVVLEVIGDGPGAIRSDLDIMDLSSVLSLDGASFGLVAFDFDLIYLVPLSVVEDGELVRLDIFLSITFYVFAPLIEKTATELYVHPRVGWHAKLGTVMKFVFVLHPVATRRLFSPRVSCEHKQ
jgi:hypothetical protein